MPYFVLLLLLSSLVAQAPTKKVSTFHLPAGEYGVVQLLQQVEQAVRAPIRTADAGDLATIAPIRLQCDLALPEQAWEDVLGALLSMRDLVVVRDAQVKGHEVLPFPRGPLDWVKERAQQVSVQELFERPAFSGPVRVVVPSKTAPPMLMGTLRVHLGAAKQPIACNPVDGGVQLIGLADSVRFALVTMASVAPDIASSLPARAVPPWPRNAASTVHRLEPGAHTVVQIVDRLAKALGRNIVVAPVIAKEDTAIPVDAAIAGDDLHFEEQLTSLLWTKQVLVLQVSGPHGLYEAVRAAPGAWPPAPRAQELSAAELIARPDLVAWVALTPETGGLTQPEVISVARAAMGALALTSLTLATTHRDGIRLTGLTTNVATVLRGLETRRAGK